MLPWASMSAIKWGIILAKNKSNSTHRTAHKIAVLNIRGWCEYSGQVFSALEVLRTRWDPFIYSANSLLSSYYLSHSPLPIYENHKSWAILSLPDHFYVHITSLLLSFLLEIVKKVCHVCLFKFYLFATFWNEAYPSLGFITHQNSHSWSFVKTH